MVLDDKVRKSFTCVTRWFTTCVNQTEFLKVIGPVTLVKKAVQPKAPAKSSAKAAAKEEAPKEAAKPAEPVKEEPQDAIAKVSALPKSKLVLDAWKREYSNAPNLYGAMPWLWENFDAEGYTILKSKYKYNEENKILFQVSNLCGGFVQRCDAVRKFAFGVMNIIGEESGPMEIVGMWLVRGPDEKIILENNPDAEYHEWIKLDISKEEDKKEIADMWCAEEEVYGKKILDSKIFK